VDHWHLKVMEKRAANQREGRAEIGESKLLSSQLS